jgi:hypothetical protein
MKIKDLPTLLREFDKEFMDGNMSKLLLRDGNERLMKNIKSWLSQKVTEMMVERNYKNCPYCQSEKDGHISGWGISPTGWQQLRDKHEKEHLEHCDKCGQPLKIINSN